MYWMTYDLSGMPMWLRGSGVLKDGVVDMQLIQTRGPKLPINEFNPDALVIDQWGTAEINFTDCRNGQLCYQSDEFGSDTLPISSLVNNGLLCNHGFFTNNAGDRMFTNELVGSSFDMTRNGEGIVFMPAIRDRNPTSGNFPRFDLLGFWLTYDQQGNQDWYYMGRLSTNQCSGNSCPIFALERPRRFQGPVFGPGYNPADLIATPIGRFNTLERVRGKNQRAFPFRVFNNSGTLILDELTNPIGY